MTSIKATFNSPRRRIQILKIQLFHQVKKISFRAWIRIIQITLIITTIWLLSFFRNNNNNNKTMLLLLQMQLLSSKSCRVRIKQVAINGVKMNKKKILIKKILKQKIITKKKRAVQINQTMSIHIKLNSKMKVVMRLRINKIVALIKILPQRKIQLPAKQQNSANLQVKLLQLTKYQLWGGISNKKSLL